MTLRGAERESSLPKEAYYTEKYFGMEQLSSLIHQIHDISKLAPSSIIEIGLGNGFTSSFLRRSGINVTTVDINPNLEPDICAPICDLDKHLNPDSKFDLAVCCEVLEHIPFEEFVENIKMLRKFSDKLYLTLPNYRPSFGISGFIRLPKFRHLFGLFIDIPRKKTLEKEHFWEVDSAKETSKKAILQILQTYYPSARVSRHNLKPNHYAFVAE